MKDGIIRADGTSRLMRANLPGSYEEFRAMAAAGALPLDVLFNAAGWRQPPTFLNKAALLKDTTAALYGLADAAVPDDVLRLLSKTFVPKRVPMYTKKTVTLSDALQKDVVYMDENGELTPYVVAYQSNPDDTVYDASCNGTWLLRSSLWAVSSGIKGRNFVGSAEETELNTTFFDTLSTEAQNAVKEVKIPYTETDGSAGTWGKHLGADGHPIKVFLPSYNEIYSTTVLRDGAFLGLYTSNADRKAMFGNAAKPYATRTTTYGSDSSGKGLKRHVVKEDGSMESNPTYTDDSIYLRPMMILDPAASFSWYEDVLGNVYPEQAYEYIITNPNGEPANMGSIPVFATGSYIGTGTFGVGSPNRLAFPFAPKLLILEYCVTLIPTDTETTQYYSSGSYKPNIKIKREGTTVSWYNSYNDPVLGSGTPGDASSQLNSSGKTYHYIAFG